MKYLTFMIVPYPGADVRSYRIRHRTLKALAVGLVLLISGAIIAGFYLRPVFRKAAEYERLRAENQLLSLEKQKIRDLTGKIESLDKLVEKIQVAQGVRAAAGIEETADDGGAGGMGQEEAAAGSPGAEKRALVRDEKATEGSSKIPYGIPIEQKSYISRFYNPEIYHFGIDIALKQGTPVMATADGTVTIADKNEELGFYVMIKHPSGHSTLYAHNSRLAVSSGDRVRKGSVIAYSGNMGHSSGPHLHYAIFDQSGNPVDPLPFLER